MTLIEPEDISMLPVFQQKRLNDVVSKEYSNPISCVNLAVYLAGYANTPDLEEMDPILRTFKLNPYGLLETVETTNPQPGDVAVFSNDLSPKHFAICLDEGKYVSLKGQTGGLSIDTKEQLYQFSNSDMVHYFKPKIGENP